MLSLADSVENNKMWERDELKDYSLPSTRIFDTKRESKQDVVWNTKLPYFWQGFPGQNEAQHNMQHRLVHSVSPQNSSWTAHTCTARLSASAQMSKSFQTNCQTSGNTRRRAKALKLFSCNLRWKRGLSPVKSRHTTALCSSHSY